MKKCTKNFLFWEILLRQFTGFASAAAELELFERVDSYLRSPHKRKKDFIDYLEMTFGMSYEEVNKTWREWYKEIKKFEKIIT